MTYVELFKKTEEELMKLVGEKREALRAFRFGVAGSKVTNVKDGRNLRREVAQILTALQSKKTSGNV